MDKSPVDIFLELVDANRKPVAGECLDAEFSARNAIEISEFKLDGESAESRAASSDDDDDDDDDDKAKKKKKKKGSKKSGPLCKFEVSKIVDKSSTFLLLAYLQAVSSKAAVLNHQFTSATITVRKSGGGQVKFLILKFTGVSVINYSLDVKSETPEETMFFKFEEIEMFYSPQNPDGSLGQKRHMSWDFQNPEENTNQVD